MSNQIWEFYNSFESIISNIRNNNNGIISLKEIKSSYERFCKHVSNTLDFTPYFLLLMDIDMKFTNNDIETQYRHIYNFETSNIIKINVFKSYLTELIVGYIDNVINKHTFFSIINNLYRIEFGYYSSITENIESNIDRIDHFKESSDDYEIEELYAFTEDFVCFVLKDVYTKIINEINNFNKSIYNKFDRLKKETEKSDIASEETIFEYLNLSNINGKYTLNTIYSTYISKISDTYIEVLFQTRDNDIEFLIPTNICIRKDNFKIVSLVEAYTYIMPNDTIFELVDETGKYNSNIFDFITVTKDNSKYYIIAKTNCMVSFYYSGTLGLCKEDQYTHIEKINIFDKTFVLDSLHCIPGSIIQKGYNIAELICIDKELEKDHTIKENNTSFQ